jgi:hypothetical protein
MMTKEGRLIVFPLLLNNWILLAYSVNGRTLVSIKDFAVLNLVSLNYSVTK